MERGIWWGLSLPSIGVWAESRKAQYGGWRSDHLICFRIWDLLAHLISFTCDSCPQAKHGRIVFFGFLESHHICAFQLPYDKQLMRFEKLLIENMDSIIKYRNRKVNRNCARLRFYGQCWPTTVQKCKSTAERENFITRFQIIRIRVSGIQLNLLFLLQILP